MIKLKMVLAPTPNDNARGIPGWKWASGTQGGGDYMVYLKRVLSAYGRHGRWDMSYHVNNNHGENYVIEGNPLGILRVMEMDGISLLDFQGNDAEVNVIISDQIEQFKRKERCPC
tara:strand:+ start:875 stop:1219 length:345 start_codon:yes stop_codon:yes gene_type:complete